MFVRGVTKAQVQQVLASDLVLEIRGNYARATVSPMKGALQQKQHSSETRMVEWGIAHIEAEKAWNITRGEGIVVGIIDTGVRSSCFSPKQKQKTDFQCNPPTGKPMRL